MDTTSETTSTRPAPYRLGIDDLFAWMTLAALALSWLLREFQLSQPRGSWSRADVSGFRFMYGCMSPLVGCQLASFYWLAKSRRRGLSFPDAPGHYILLLAGFDFLAHVVQSEMSRLVLFLSVLLSWNNPNSPNSRDDWKGFVISLILVGLVAHRMPHWRWRLYFWIQFAYVLLFLTMLHLQSLMVSSWSPSAAVIQRAVLICYAGTFCLFCASACWTAVCLGWDWHAGRRWDFLHYVGVFCVWAKALGIVGVCCLLLIS